MSKKVTKATKAALKSVTKAPVRQSKKPAAVKKEVKKPMPTKPAAKKAIIKEVKTVEVTSAKEVTTVESHKPAKVTHVNTSDLQLAVEVETVELETVIVKESDQDLINQKAKLLKKEKAAEKAANPTPAVTKKTEPSSISFEDIKKHLLKPLPTTVPSFLRK